MSHLHQKVSALVDGELSGAARERALKHVAKCPDCRRELQETLALKARLSGLPVFDPSPDLFATLGGVTDAHHPSTELPTARGWMTARRFVFGAGTLSVAVLSIAYVVGGPDEPATPTVAPSVDELQVEFGTAAGDDPLTGSMAPGVGPDADEPASPDSGDASGPAKLTLAVASPFIAMGDERRALQVLKRAVRAPSLFGFAGTRQVQSFEADAPVVQTLEVAHVPGQGTTVEVGGTGHTAFVNDDGAAAERLSTLVASYDLAVLGHEDVIDRPATIIGAGHEGHLYARAWIDDETGLVLRKELYDEAGSLVRSTEYVSLEAPADWVSLNRVDPEFTQPPAVDLGVDDAPRMRDAGWACPDSLPDRYQLTGLSRIDEVDHGEIMHAEYTDGLSTVSVFSEVGQLDASTLDGFVTGGAVGGADEAPVYSRTGLPSVVVWESDSTVYTVVSDAPVDDVSAVVGALPHGVESEPGLGSRVGTGLDEMATFLTPLG